MGKLTRQIKRNKLRKVLSDNNEKLCNRDDLRRRLKRLRVPYHEDSFEEYYQRQMQAHYTGDKKLNKTKEDK